MANIRGNIASGNATQVNVNVLSDAGPPRGAIYDRDLVDKFLNMFFESLIPPSKGAKLMANIENGSPVDKSIKHSFSLLKPFHGDFERAAGNYRRIQRGAIGSRFIVNRTRIGPWLASKESAILTMYAPLDEATKLTFETIEVVDSMITRSQKSSQDLRLVHLFGEKSSQKKGNPNIMILDLISQVMKHHERNTGQARPFLSHIETADPKVLWENFWQQVRNAGVQRLFIFLDNIDQFFMARPRGDSSKRAWKCLVDNLRPPNHQNDIQIKVWVTCNTRKPQDCFR